MEPAIDQPAPRGFLRELEAVLRDRPLIPPRATAVVAVSGGCDSMTLLHALAALRPRHAWNLAVAHLDHGLRGAAAEADRDLVLETAAALGLNSVSEHIDVAAQRRPGESLEESARRHRHAFLARAATARGADRIVTGHHADDQAELFLLRLLRGAGGRGLGGMDADVPSPADPRIRIVRPFLGFPRAKILEAARAWGIRWRDDASNDDTRFLRNRVRSELLPLLAARFQPALARVLARTQTLIRDQAAVVEGLARAWLTRSDAAPFESLPAAVQRDALRLALEQARVAPGFDLIEALRLDPGTPVQCRPDLRLAWDPVRRELVTPPAAPGPLPPYQVDVLRLDLSSGRGAASFGGVAFEWRTEDMAGDRLPPGRAAGCEHLDADRLGGVITLRHWRPGDRFEPIGLGAAARLQDLFTTARMARDARRRCVLGETSEGSLFWVEGLRLGAVARLTPATCRRLIWHWQRRVSTP